MNFPEAFTTTGSLLGLRRGSSTTWLQHALSVEQEETGVRGWHRLLWIVNEPLAGEVSTGVESFSYPFLFRSSSEREHALLFGNQGVLVETFLKRCLPKARVFCPALEIPRLVKDLVAEPVQYSMSAIYARVEGYGQNLRTMALYGSDVGNADVLRDLLPALQAYRVTLRRIDTGKEVLSIGSRGEASFLYRGKNSLRNVDAVLRFLTNKRYIDWSRQLTMSLR